MIAVLVAVGALVTAVLVVRGAPEAPEVPAAAPAAGGPSVLPGSADGDLVSVPPAAPSTPASSPASSSGSGAGPVTVDVAGRVRRPGIAVLDAGARVIDALEAAGGAKPRVDLSTLNLARLLVDGEQILVGVAAAPVPAAPPGAGAGAPPGTGPAALVNLNTATAAELDTLPEVGPVTAAAIIAWRDEHGGFTAVEELLEVQGIGETTLGQIAPHATV